MRPGVRSKADRPETSGQRLSDLVASPGLVAGAGVGFGSRRAATRVLLADELAGVPEYRPRDDLLILADARLGVVAHATGEDGLELGKLVGGRRGLVVGGVNRLQLAFHDVLGRRTAGGDARCRA